VSYVPTYVQGVLGTGALVAGFAVAAMTIGWPIAAALSGRLYLRIGFRNTALIGAVIALAGGILVALLGSSSPVLAVAGACFVVGVGLGFASVPTIVAGQSVVDWSRRGVVTGTNMFCRNLGSAVGVAVFGAIANQTLSNRFADAPANVARHLPAVSGAERAVLDASHRSGAAAAYLHQALYDSAHNVFLVGAAVSVVGLLVLLIMPRTAEPLEFD
jgi:MFS family permease